MSQQRLRDYQIIVGSSAEAFSGKPELQKKAKDATILENLQFEGTVSVSNKKSTTSNDSTQFKFYNLSKQIQEQFKVPGATMMIRAGYTDVSDRTPSGEIVRKPEELPVVFLGTIIHSFTVRRGQDVVTTVYASSDMMERATSKGSYSFSPGTKVSEVINTLLNHIDLPRGHIDLLSVDQKVYVGGLSIYGKLMNALQRICDEWNLRFFVHDKKVNIVPKIPNKESKVVVWDVFPFNIIDTPERSYERTQTKDKKASKRKSKTSDKAQDEKATVTKNGVSITLHLDGRIKVGSHVRINNLDDFNGLYRVEGLSHQLSYRGGSWSTGLDLLPM